MKTAEQILHEEQQKWVNNLPPYVGDKNMKSSLITAMHEYGRQCFEAGRKLAEHQSMSIYEYDNYEQFKIKNK